MPTVRYIVDDVDAAVAFYTAQLGFTLIEQYGPAMAILDYDGLQLWVAGPAASASRPMPDGARPRPGGWARVVINMPNLSARVAQMKAADVAFLNDMTDGPGGRQILCADPSGNCVELFEPTS